MSTCPSRPAAAGTRWTSGAAPPRASADRLPAAISAARSPRFQATSRPPSASTGRDSSTRSASRPTARAVTIVPAGTRSGGPQRLDPGRGDGDAILEPDGEPGHVEKRRLLRDGLHEDNVRCRKRGGQGEAREAAAAAEVQEGGVPSAAQQVDGREAVGDVESRDCVRLRDRGEVDRRVPGEEEADVAVDRRARRGVQVHAQRREGTVQRARVRRGQGGEGGDARRERFSLAVQACLLGR